MTEEAIKEPKKLSFFNIIHIISAGIPVLATGIFGLYHSSFMLLIVWLVIILLTGLVIKPWAFCSHCEKYKTGKCWKKIIKMSIIPQRQSKSFIATTVFLIATLAIALIPLVRFAYQSEYTFLVIYICTLLSYSMTLKSIIFKNGFKLECPIK